MFTINKQSHEIQLQEFKKVENKIQTITHLDLTQVSKASQASLSKCDKYFAMIDQESNRLFVWDIQNRKKHQDD